ncbi:secretion/DNA translocation related CpaE-like protein [Nocardiopsis sp. Huas11]|uniref:septum site-determining protein Ssd n=1 Tax=Nocardiopsis sp. Huas11 TaxID=2183912 RepID=UPI000EAD6029|nr:septum site-determining protein Ssd [Nocardiopsis sp. Huas11]RKS06418.1 secretion/DNA translocation related CpaE-like protein [Nocardiopsis sp. Huas11]
MDVRTRPLIATADPALLDDLLRLASAASTEVNVARTVDQALRSWSHAPLAVVGADLRAALSTADPPPHPRLVVVGRATGGTGTATGAPPGSEASSLLLPRDESALAGLLSRADAPARPPAPTVSVVGGRGGAGSSLLGVALALAGERAGRSTALLDTDPLGCGSDLYLGCDDSPPGPGGRTGWGDLLVRHGRVHWRDLREGLPGTSRVSVLTWTRRMEPARAGSLPVGAARAVLASARHGTDLVVADLPRCPSPASAVFLNRSDLVYVVVPADVPSVVAAARLVPWLAEESASVQVVVRGAHGGLTADAVAGTLGLPLGADLPDEPGLDRDLAAGRAPARQRRSPLARFADRAVAELSRVRDAR